MADHVRKQIRGAAKTALTGLVTTGANVFVSKRSAFHNEQSNLPALCIYTNAEEVANEEGDDISHIQQRAVLLFVEAKAKGTAEDTLDDTLDKIAKEVETAIYADQFFTTGGVKLTAGIDLVGSDVDIEAAEKFIGTITLIFKVYYLTNEGAPDIAL